MQAKADVTRHRYGDSMLTLTLFIFCVGDLKKKNSGEGGRDSS
jgi:hypothetical protein